MTIAFTQKDAPASPRLPGGCWATYPDEQLGQDHVALPAGQVQRRPAVSLPAGFVHLVPGAVRQQQDDRPQVLVGRGPQQVLAQGQLCAGQRGQEELLLVLGPDPPLLLLPARASRRAWSQSRGGGWRRPLCPAASLCGVCPGGRQRRGHVRDKCAHRHQEAPRKACPAAFKVGPHLEHCLELGLEHGLGCRLSGPIPAPPLAEPLEGSVSPALQGIPGPRQAGQTPQARGAASRLSSHGQSQDPRAHGWCPLGRVAG